MPIVAPPMSPEQVAQFGRSVVLLAFCSGVAGAIAWSVLARICNGLADAITAWEERHIRVIKARARARARANG